MSDLRYNIELTAPDIAPYRAGNTGVEYVTTFTATEPGPHVAVFGLRRTDGVVVASLVEPRHGTAMRVAGLLERVGNDVRIGGLLLDQVDPALVGQRVTVEGHVTQGVMQVARAKADDLSDLRSQLQ